LVVGPCAVAGQVDVTLIAFLEERSNHNL
jgi:hypothetical protein